MTALEDTAPQERTVHRPGRIEPWRDKLGRYRIVVPSIAQTGNDKNHGLRSFTRASSVADTLEDKERLTQWRMRKLAYGLGRQRDLLDLASGHDPDDDRHLMDDVVNQAIAAADAHKAANQGTALHRFTEKLDEGLWGIDDVPAEWRLHMTQYLRAIERSGFEIVNEHCERVIAMQPYKIAGTIDRILRATRDVEVKLPGWDVPHVIQKGQLIIGDLKTGKLEQYHHNKFPIQLTIYANHDCTWYPMDNETGGQLGPRIDVDRDVALIFHLPTTNAAGTCRLHWCDLRAGWRNFEAAMEVKECRRNRRYNIVEYTPHVSIEEARTIWLRERIAALGQGTPAEAALKACWPLRDDAGYPRKLAEVAEAEDILAVSAALDQVESMHMVAFGERMPTGDETAAADQLIGGVIR